MSTQRQHLPLVASRTVVRLAPHMAVYTVSNWGHEHLADTVELVVSELVTNAVEAAIAAGLNDDPYPWDVTSGHRIDLTLQARPKGIDILVADQLPGTPVMQTADTTGDPISQLTEPHAALAQMEEHGRGLLLVAHLTEDWGYYPGEEGKVVWCRVGIPR